MYYMSVNIGSFFSMLATPWLAAKYGWSVAFSLSVVGMLITLVNFMMCHKWVKENGSKPDFKPLHLPKLLMVLVGIVALIAVSSWLLHNQVIARWALALVSAGIVLVFAKETFALHGAARRKMIVAFLLMLEAVVFFVLYSQMPTSLNFFAIHNVEHSIFGVAFEPEQYQALNPFWIMLASPILAALYNKMGDRLPMPHKFAFGMILCSCAFLVLPWGRQLRQRTGHRVGQLADPELRAAEHRRADDFRPGSGDGGTAGAAASDGLHHGLLVPDHRRRRADRR